MLRGAKMWLECLQCGPGRKDGHNSDHCGGPLAREAQRSVAEENVMTDGWAHDLQIRKACHSSHEPPDFVPCHCRRCTYSSVKVTVGLVPIIFLLSRILPMEATFGMKLEPTKGCSNHLMQTKNLELDRLTSPMHSTNMSHHVS